MIPGENGAQISDEPFGCVEAEDADGAEWFESKRDERLRSEHHLGVVLQEAPRMHLFAPSATYAVG